MRRPARLSVSVLLLAALGCEGSLEPGQIRGQPPVPMPPADAVGGFGIDLPPVTVPPGGEVQPCWIFPLHIDGPSNIVGGGSLVTGTGLHHGNVTTRKKTGEGMRECQLMPGDNVGFDIVGGGSVLFASSTQVKGGEWQSFPRGMGYRLREEGYEIIARMHYLNPSAEPVTVAPRYRWYTIAESALVQELSPFAWQYSGFQIPPMSDYTVTTFCKLDTPMHIVSILPHMHGLGRRISAGFYGGPRDSAFFFDDANYAARGDSDMLQYDPAVDTGQDGAGLGIRFQCTWHNSFDKVIVEGVGDNEMCIIFGYAYPRGGAYSAYAVDVDSCTAITAP